MIRISYRYRKYAWLAGCVICGLILYLLVVTPLRANYQGTLERIEMAEVKLDRSQRLVDRQNLLDRQIQQIEARIKNLEASMFQGETASLVGAKMQEIMDGICRKNGADIRQTRVLKESDIGSYKEISIKVDMVSSLPALSKIIFDLNHDAYLFLIPEINTRSTGGNAKNNVRTQMTVVGLMRGK